MCHAVSLNLFIDTRTEYIYLFIDTCTEYIYICLLMHALNIYIYICLLIHALNVYICLLIHALNVYICLLIHALNIHIYLLIHVLNIFICSLIHALNVYFCLLFCTVCLLYMHCFHFHWTVFYILLGWINWLNGFFKMRLLFNILKQVFCLYSDYFMTNAKSSFTSGRVLVIRRLAKYMLHPKVSDFLLFNFY